MPNPLFAQARAQARVCASGLAFALVEHWVSTMETFVQLSAAAKAGKAKVRTRANSKEILFMCTRSLSISDLKIARFKQAAVRFRFARRRWRRKPGQRAPVHGPQSVW